MADALKNIITSKEFTEHLPCIGRQQITYCPNGPVKPYLQLDNTDGTAVMKSTIYMALHFHVTLPSRTSMDYIKFETAPSMLS